MNKYRNIRFLGAVFVLMLIVVGITAAKTSPLEGSNSVSVPTGDADAKISQAPLNPKFVEYQLMKNRGLDIARQKAPNGRGLGLAPSPVDLSHVGASSSGPGSGSLETTVSPLILNLEGDLPTSYDLRNFNGVTPVKDQGNAGTCWAFATYGSLESYLMPDEWNFSENNMKNLLSNAAPEGFDFPDGGNQFMSTAYLARWSGPIDESDDPYDASSSYSEGYPAFSEMKHVQEVEFIPGAQGPSADEYIKQAIMEKGAVYSTMYVDTSDFYSRFNSATNAYYYEGSSSSNHAITIVGWDDSFPSSNFLNTPPGDGAFIVKNSWGTGWGNNGYFYISYYDSQIGTSNAVFTAEGTDNYDFVYQYDPLGWVTSIGYGTTTAWAANVFTATGYEQIKAVSFYTTDSDTIYNLNIYTGVAGGPTLGDLVCEQNGPISTSGYHTAVLDVPVSISEGQKFSVVVKLSNPAYKYPIALEKPFSGYSSNAVANPGESYISSNGESWTDVTSIRTNKETNVCIKAFTVENPTEAHDVAVTGITAPDFVVKGDIATIQVTVKNQGSSLESSTLILTDEYDTWVVGSEPVSLAAGASDTYMFEWDTAGVEVAIHSLNATVQGVADESDLQDNSMTTTVSIEEIKHDVAVMSVTAPSSVTVGEGVSVDITVKNEGNRVETFYVPLVSDNATPDTTDDIEIGNQSITLGAGNSTTFIYTWDTESSNSGVYTLNATAGPVDGEFDTSDNSRKTSVTVSDQSSTPEMYVWDISFSTAGPHLKAKVTIRADSNENGVADSMDALVSGATVGFTYTNFGTSYGITDSSGAVEFLIKRASGTAGTGEVTSLTHDTYGWNDTLDVNNPANYLQ